MRVNACAGTFDTLRRPIGPDGVGEVERGEQRAEEVAADVEVDRPPPGAVERARPTRAAPTVHERGQVGRDARAEQGRVESAGDGQDRVADRLGVEPARLPAVEQER